MRYHVAIVIFLLLGFTGVIPAQTSQPHLSNPTLAKVGNVSITKAMIDERLGRLPENLPAKKRNEIQAKLLESLIFKNLVKEYLRANNIPYTAEDLAEAQQQEQATHPDSQTGKKPAKQEELKTLARALHLQKEALQPEKIDALIKAHPEFFDGTKICASHILIPCSPLASTREQKEARDKIRRLQTDINAGQISFADAARTYSGCPSRTKGGDLGEFSFREMAPTFAQAAFTTPNGDLSEIVRTKFGFHIIHVTARSKGSGKPGPNARTLAMRLLMAELENRIFDQALTTVPIVIFEETSATTQKASPENTE